MLKKLKIIRINKFSKLFVILSFIANTLLFAQEQKIELKIYDIKEKKKFIKKKNYKKKFYKKKTK